MNNINNELNQIMVKATVDCMLNPDNGFFYFPRMKLLDIEKMFNGMPEETRNQAVQGFFDAYAIAERRYKEQLKEIEENKPYHADVDYLYDNICPECGCHDFVPGVACPNCDYVD